MDTFTSQILLAAITLLGTVATSLFGYLKYRDDKRITYIEEELVRSTAEMVLLRNKVEVLTMENRKLERERDQLQYRLNMVEELSDEQEKKIEKLQGNEASCNREIDRLRTLLEKYSGDSVKSPVVR